MVPGELKPVLTALALPPTGPLLLALLALLLVRRRRGAGRAIAAAAILLALALSTQGVGLLLARHLLPVVQPVQPRELQQVQAIVILGGGIRVEAPEYGAPQPSEATLARLRYGARLVRQSGKPLAFAGGVGWSAAEGAPPEAAVAQRILREDYGLELRWVDDRSRDTRENAERIAALAGRDGVRRIALVTDALHLPRAAAEFRRAGFEVVPAPTSFPARTSHAWLEWLPSAAGLADCRYVLREWLAVRLARLA